MPEPQLVATTADMDAVGVHSVSFFLAKRQDNFLLLRIIAAAMVIYGHSFALTSDIGDVDLFLRLGWGRYSGDIAVSMFFVISGFMVSGSYLARAGLSSYLGARLLRIVPAYVFVLVVSAYVIGPTVTILPEPTYFANQDVWRYVSQNLHFSSDMVWDLPGVFGDQRRPSMNGSLWTLPAEMRMYFLVAALGVLGLLGNRRLGVVAIAALFLAALINPQLLPVHSDWVHLGGYFCAGILVQLFKERVQIRHDAMLVLVFLTYISFYTESYRWLLGLTISYFCFWFAYRTPVVKLERLGDPSYGVYLWGWPAQQVVVSLWPKVSPWANFLISLPIAILMGYVSWRLIERPALALKGKLKDLRGHSKLAWMFPLAGNAGR